MIPILTYAFKNIKGKVRFLPLLLILLIFAIQIEGTVTTSLVLGLVMFFFCLFSKRINFKWIIAALLIVAFLFQTGLISDMLGYSSNMLADNQDLQQRVLELKDAIDNLCDLCNTGVIFDNVRSIIVAIWESIAARASVSKAGNVCDYDAETAKGLRDG